MVEKFLCISIHGSGSASNGMDKDKLLEWLDKATTLELNEVVKAIEEKFGVSAAAIAVASAGAGATGAPAAEEQSAYTVVLASAGEQKIAVMKIVKEILGLGLKDAKDLVDAAPSTLKEGMKKAEATELKKKIEEAGGKIELK
ncbi:MAG: 50S ribosomal protein L7/L12 [Candidatus Nomurabacteria bacterium GW2011_GWF2_40_31]|uniref:Large ribosomal subunit protein bL12 n=2 Tax=Candidatus Nomuraibacteriota TaxID=1752729 RepID=A0A837HQJ3_9BACT|nr:MAG: 50S ribosomal protein L7/L12 [Candidatus Nomurabacteria bacterium GW2011_GWD2_39_12]KKR20151.1 MAG: 50S ribosomal protein L7/L12 [Candidatus Nomurabacteria bacterium GW2011_GWC2_39_41]KKR36492.1 MAG: 50S ribosomal protein L7/L12 [Candidatus Nomurabacteria bacterium GW2011_GWE2_40_10]KKR37995.1 MAG: 50S ribosomal protein L7/L12 [Candidatus Nomurabacteria bacterium GW2011_GWB1_40_11]KKR39501.1 MAG: 50S ribosomal protein L7/L12 [Parcubacteria group bacterium GW2011_GWC1_40_11]KKR59024.1 M